MNRKGYIPVWFDDSTLDGVRVCKALGIVAKLNKDTRGLKGRAMWQNGLF